MSDPYAEFRPSSDDNLKAVLRTLADQLLEAEARQAEIEEMLEAAKAKVKEIAEVTIPAATEGIEGTLDLGDGRKMTIKEEIRASIAGEKLAPAVKWLDDNDYSSIVKREFVFKFNRQDQEKMRVFKEILAPIVKDLGLVLEEKNSVHNATLVAWVKEQLSEGVDLPKETFGIFRQRTAKVKS